MELDGGEIPAEESDPDLDPGEIQPKRPWLEEARHRLFYGLRRVRRYGRFGLSYTRYYGRLGLRYGRRWGWPVVLWFATLSLSFFVLVRGSMYTYQSMGWGTWSSIGLGMLGTIFVFSAYLAWLWTHNHWRCGRAPVSAAGADRRCRGIQHVWASLPVGRKLDRPRVDGLLHVSASTHQTRSQCLRPFRPKRGRHGSGANGRRLPRDGSPHE